MNLSPLKESLSGFDEFHQEFVRTFPTRHKQLWTKENLMRTMLKRAS
jgi:hypothetical protein